MHWQAQWKRWFLDVVAKAILPAFIFHSIFIVKNIMTQDLALTGILDPWKLWSVEGCEDLTSESERGREVDLKTFLYIRLKTTTKSHESNMYYSRMSWKYFLPIIIITWYLDGDFSANYCEKNEILPLPSLPFELLCFLGFLLPDACSPQESLPSLLKSVFPVGRGQESNSLDLLRSNEADFISH